jgi:hypothetical protein
LRLTDVNPGVLFDNFDCPGIFRQFLLNVPRPVAQLFSVDLDRYFATAVMHVNEGETGGP